jgi:hypothetical protein
MKIPILGCLALSLLLTLAGLAGRGETTTVAAQGFGNGNTVVLCSNCYFPGTTNLNDMTRVGLWLMDGTTGEIWLYNQAAMLGQQAPTFLGKLARVGDSVRPR